MLESPIGSLLDRTIYKPAYKWAKHFDTEKDQISYFNELIKNNKSNMTFHQTTIDMYSAIDTKASALLTHVSILATTTSILISTIDKSQNIMKFMYLIEILSYLLSAIICLRSIRFSIPNLEYTREDGTTARPDRNASEATFDEIMKRRSALVVSTDITLITTFLMAITTFTHAIIGVF